MLNTRTTDAAYTDQKPDVMDAEIVNMEGPATLQNVLQSYNQQKARGGGQAWKASRDDVKTSTFACCSRQNTSMSKALTRKYRRVSSQKSVVLMRMLWPLLVYAAYYVYVSAKHLHADGTR
jgi:hypothetical protein